MFDLQEPDDEVFPSVIVFAADEAYPTENLLRICAFANGALDGPRQRKKKTKKTRVASNFGHSILSSDSQCSQRSSHTGRREATALI